MKADEMSVDGDLGELISDLRAVERQRKGAVEGSRDHEVLLDAEDRLRRRILDTPVPDARRLGRGLERPA